MEDYFYMQPVRSKEFFTKGVDELNCIFKDYDTYENYIELYSKAYPEITWNS